LETFLFLTSASRGRSGAQIGTEQRGRTANCDHRTEDRAAAVSPYWLTQAFRHARLRELSDFIVAQRFVAQQAFGPRPIRRRPKTSAR
jgi:hypothetical protein